MLKLKPRLRAETANKAAQCSSLPAAELQVRRLNTQLAAD